MLLRIFLESIFQLKNKGKYERENIHHELQEVVCGCGSKLLTINVEDDCFGFWGHYVVVAGLADQSCMQMLAAHVWECQVIDDHPVRSILVRTVYYCVFQEPNHFWGRSTCRKIESQSHSDHYKLETIILNNRALILIIRVNKMAHNS